MSNPKMAIRAALGKLWVLVLDSLREKVAKPNPSAEILFVARRFLLDAGYTPQPTVRSTASLKALQASYIQALQPAVNSPKPSASMLGEARMYLLQQKVTHERDAQEHRQQEHSSIPFH